VEGSPARLQFGPVTLVPSERVVLKDDLPIALTPKAFDLLAFLAANPGRLLTKDELLQAVWPDVVVEESNLSYHIFAIRKALGDGSDSEKYIETVPKRGYRFTAPVQRLEGSGAPEAVSSVEAPAEDSRSRHRQSLRRPRAWIVGLAGVTIGALAAPVIWESLPRLAAPPPALQHFQEPLWGRPAEPTMFSISPDGHHLLAAIQGVDGVARLWVRTLNEPTPRALPGSEGFIMPPAIWSPGSDAVAFANGGPLKRVALSGGVPQNVCAVWGIAVGGSWNRDDVILVGNPGGPLLRCPSSGGRATPVTKTTDPHEIHLMPTFLSDGRHFIYLRIHRTAPERSGVYIGDLNGESPAGEQRLFSTGFNAIPVHASDAGPSAVVFLRDGALYAQRFDEHRRELRGAPVRLTERVGSYIDYAYFSVSPRVLVYRSPDPLYQLTWFDREGREMRRIGGPEPVAGLAMSPSADRALVSRHTPHNVVDQDLWLFELNREANPRRLTYSASLESWPTWLTDERFAYGATGGETNFYEQTLAGERRVWFQALGNNGPTGVRADGSIAVFVGFDPTNPTMRADLWVWTTKGAPGGAPLLRREGDQAQAQLSPDGHWLAYVSNETGRNEVFVAPFQYHEQTGKVSVGESVPVSEGGGFAPRWRGDGKELFYLKIDGSVMAVEVNRPAGALGPGASKRLFTALGVFPEWGVTRDGSRLLFAVPTAPTPPLNIIQNWQSALPN
jgi:eukaryotic-like serine/threonine-protein kinase